MQKELTQEGLPTTIQLLGVNEAGQEADNALICHHRDLPWLQEARDHSVWDAWKVTYRDVIILDADNEPVTIYNLTRHTLADPSSYAELKEHLRQAARASP